MLQSRSIRKALAWILMTLPFTIAGCAAEPTPVPGTPAPAGLTDANISSVTQSYNTSEVRIAELAAGKASTEAIKSFAQKMARDHNQSNTQLNSILSSQKIQPSPYSATTDIQQAEQNSMATLQNRSGVAFDQAYLDAEISHHRWLINQLDTNLIPGARDSVLRKYLRELRATEAAHLREAEQLRGRIGGS